ncbi:MAG TPA: (2Fe-2S)-binding protein, partial [Deltaproteobacteria bacterium]|nr:(2Fe-2S)-binding protein [Deltaproteobacteria bacterium]
PVAAAVGTKITTIEGLSHHNKHPVQQAWLEEQVPQCGYCQSGQIMATAALLAKNPKPTAEEVEDNITNLCRCGTYVRVRRGISRSAELMRKQRV